MTWRRTATTCRCTTAPRGERHRPRRGVIQAQSRAARIRAFPQDLSFDPYVGTSFACAMSPRRGASPVVQANDSTQHQNPEGDLTDKEKDEVDRRTLIRAAVTHETVRRQGEDELERTTLALLLSGLAAGLAIGFSMIAQGILKARLPDADWSRLVSKLGYCAGFLIVILGRKQLYTENTLTAVVPLLNRREAKAFLNVVRLLSVVLLANLIGAHLFAWFAAKAPVLDESVRVAIREIGHEGIKGD